MRQMNLEKAGIDAIVAVLDETRETEYFRNPDRPSGRFIQNRRWQDPEVSRAKARIRTAHWRNRMDARGAPTASQIGMAMVKSLVTSRLDELTDAERSLIGRALVELQVRGFCIVETKNVLRKLRNRLVDEADRPGEPD
jgi:hypothetical protein